MKKLFNYLLKFLNTREIVLFYFSIILTFLSSIFEILSIGLLIPIFKVLNENEDLFKYKIFKYSIELSSQNLILIFIIILILSTIIRISSISFNAFYSAKIGNKISLQMLKIFLKRPYEDQILNNSSEDISKLVSKINDVIKSLLFPILQMFSGALSAIIIITPFLFFNLKITLSIITGITLIYSTVSFFFKGFLKRNSKLISNNQDAQISIIQESFISLKDLILNNSFSFFLSKYEYVDTQLRKSQASNIIIAQSPRFLIESLTTVFILVMFLFFKENNIISGDQLLTVFIVIAFALQKLLPISQQIYRSWANIQGNKDSLNDVLSELENNQEEEHSGKIIFNENISFKNISFHYKNSKNIVFSSINLELKKSSSYLIFGETGVGKSTLVEIISGLLKPSNGEILVDNSRIELNDYHRKIRNLISYVPQDTFVLNKSITENIAFGLDDSLINYKRVKYAVKVACLEETVKNKNGLNHVIIENGKDFSGGQKQRISIARAIYAKPEILVLDEATSSLDQKTTRKLIKNITNLNFNPTVIMISHDRSLQSYFDYSFELKDKNLIQL